MIIQDQDGNLDIGHVKHGNKINKKIKIMYKSYSKIRHIQESNQRLEQNYLKENKLINENALSDDPTNTTEPAQTGATQTGEIRSSAALQGFFNIFRGASKDVSPKMAAAQSKIRNKATELIKTLNEFSQEIENAYRDRESDMSTINNNLQAKIDKEQDKDKKAALSTKQANYKAAENHTIKVMNDFKAKFGPFIKTVKQFQ
ncbi:MAG: hypothetical protein RLZ10_1087 [Bacteroidota bacterium]